MSVLPESNAWNDFQEIVDEREFTPWANKGWIAHNGQSPEIAVCDFVRNLVTMMQPRLVIETGVGQGYMTRIIASALSNTGGRLVAFESDDEWRAMMRPLYFWTDRAKVCRLSDNDTPSADAFSLADLSIVDSDFAFRFEEVRLWSEVAKEGAVALVHDTADRDDTIHQSLRGLIVGLGMTGVFLNNPRGCFLAVQPKEKDMGRWNEGRWVQTGVDSSGDPVYSRNLKAGDLTVPSTELSLKQLRAQAEERGLPTYGTKAELVERLAG